MFEFVATKYYSEKRGLLNLRYKLKVTILDDSGYIEYVSANGRKCKMNFFENSNGYLWTSLAVDDKTKISGRINRLVYSNIYGEIPKGYQIDHIDKNRKNNYPYNLRLTTYEQNNATRTIHRGEEVSNSKLTREQVRDILILVLEHRKTKQQIADDYGVSFATIKAIRSGRNWLSFTKDIFEQYNIKKEV